MYSKLLIIKSGRHLSEATRLILTLFFFFSEIPCTVRKGTFTLKGSQLQLMDLKSVADMHLKSSRPCKVHH